MQDLRKRMRMVAKELQAAERRFSRSLRDRSEPPKTALLDLQRRLDNLRQGIWEARKLCDPHLVAPKPSCEAEPSSTLAERIVQIVDLKRKRGSVA